MFSALKQGGRVYILNKGEDFSLSIGHVEEFTVHPKNEHGRFPAFAIPQEMVVDVKVRIGQDVAEFKDLNANMNIANSGELVVSDSQEAMSVEVEGLLRNSQQAIDSMPYHDKVVKACVPILRELNPQFAKEKEQEEKIGALEERMVNIDEKLTMMYDLLSDTLNHKKPKE